MIHSKALRVRSISTGSQNFLFFILVTAVFFWSLGVLAVPAPAPTKFTVMSYNVQNLFDASHDPGKDDFTFLPAGHALKSKCYEITDAHYRAECLQTDWSEEKLSLKIEQIKKAVMSGGELPELLALQEVENANVIQQLAQRLGYSRWVMTNSPDRRGIDVALLYSEKNLTLVDWREARNSTSGLITRNHLVAHFQAKNSGPSNAVSPKEVLAVYVNHWPAQSAPWTMRYQTAQSLRAFIDSNRSRFIGTRYHVLALGDFNLAPSDQRDSIQEVLLDPNWKLRMFDSSHTSPAVAQNAAPGTYFYSTTGEWLRFDRILLSGYLRDDKGLEVISGSYGVVSPGFLTAHSNKSWFPVPKRFNSEAAPWQQVGYSDHFPVKIQIQLSKN